MSKEHVTADRDHLVQFYTRADELAEPVAGYVAGAVLEGGAAVAVVAAGHRSTITQALDAALAPGADTAKCLEEGSLVLLDAEETLERLLVDGKPDPARFEAVVGDTILRAARRHSPLHAYGEMVDCLWQAGRLNAAIALEDLWNRLLERAHFSLYCSYRSSTASDGLVVGYSDSDGMFEVCSLHSAVVQSPPEAAVAVPFTGKARKFPAEARSVRRARGFVAEALHGLPAEPGDHMLVDRAVLVASELATNALVHASSGFSVHVFLIEGGGVRVSVADAKPGSPAAKRAEDDELSGRGLAIVAALSSKWGSAEGTDGKIVWAELAPQPSLPPRS
jgi:anti-sigma regulatory factor (Ser/Thr protein kinase)